MNKSQNKAQYLKNNLINIFSINFADLMIQITYPLKKYFSFKTKKKIAKI